MAVFVCLCSILEVGVLPTFTPVNGSDLAALAAARAHLTMWAILKSPILLVRCEAIHVLIFTLSFQSPRPGSVEIYSRN
jgi:hypothetical protein